jgi:aminoglycoside 6'-N-acetyltransferase
VIEKEENAPVEIRGARTSLRPVVVPDDVDTLLEWHADPDVIRYWDDETFTRDELVARLLSSEVDAFIIELEATPVGYIQAWQSDAEQGGGVDMFLAPGFRGQGIGPDAGRALAEHLRRDRRWTYVTADPYLWNERALRAWRRAGFVPVEERPPDEHHLSSWVLMEFRDRAVAS